MARNTLILGIESSCDETAAAVVENGVNVLSSVIASQIDIHTRYGGIVPEVASRQHLLSFLPVLEQAMSGISPESLSGIAVTVGPGLAGSLLVGVNLAKALALSWNLPLVPVNHVEGHIYAAWMEGHHPEFPLAALLVSGGHTELVLMTGHGKYELLGRTRDDAVGEAFDKVARVLGLGYPGGPAIEKAALSGHPQPRLPRAWIKGSDDFSFSGIKTAVLHLCRETGIPGPQPDQRVFDMAASFQEAVTDVLVAKTVAAARRAGARCIILAGGVAANKHLRHTLQQRSPLPVFIPGFSLCTDNAAMIACCGHYRLQAGATAGWGLDVNPGLRLATPAGAAAPGDGPGRPSGQALQRLRSQ